MGPPAQLSMRLNAGKLFNVSRRAEKCVALGASGWPEWADLNRCASRCNRACRPEIGRRRPEIGRPKSRTRTSVTEIEH
eukprot:8822809-Alexandrium_andersonii.AAC.1